MTKFNNFNARTTSIKNTGFRKQVTNKLGVIRGGILIPKGIEIDTEILAETIGTWQDLLKADKPNRAYYLPLFSEFADNSTDDEFTEDLNGQVLNEEGEYIMDFMWDVNKYLAVNLRSFNSKQWTFCPIDESRSIWGRTTDGVKMQGFDLQLLHVGKQKLAEAKGKVMTPIKMVMADSTQFSDEGVIVEPFYAANPWNPITDLDGIYDADLTASNVSATGFVLDVNIGGIDASQDDSKVIGLDTTPDTGDFRVYEPDGITLWTPASITDNEDGTYTFVGTALTTLSTVNIVKPSETTLTEYLVESTGAATLTVA